MPTELRIRTEDATILALPVGELRPVQIGALGFVKVRNQRDDRHLSTLHAHVISLVSQRVCRLPAALLRLPLLQPAGRSSGCLRLLLSVVWLRACLRLPRREGAIAQ